MNKNSKIYIAGHLGLVGSAILTTLKQKGYTNFILKTHHELDLTRQQDVADFFAAEQPEYVFLSAARVGGISANNTYRGQFIYENLMIQNNVIHAAWVSGVKKLLFLGSTCIYPRNSPQPMAETCLLTSPLEYTNEPYAIAKIAGVKLCESYNLQYGTNFISAMPTNLYGPNDNFDLEKSHVLPAMLRKIYLGKCLGEGNLEAIRQDLNKRPIEGVSGALLNEDDRKTGIPDNEIIKILEKYGIKAIHSEDLSPTATPGSPRPVQVSIWGSGSPLREFLWSEEMADACVFLMENIDFKDLIRVHAQLDSENHTTSNPESSSEIRNTHINIGTGHEISIRDLAYLLKEKTGFQGEFVFDASKPDGTMRKLTDPSKLHNLGWHHRIAIEEGVEKLYKWYLEN